MVRPNAALHPLPTTRNSPLDTIVVKDLEVHYRIGVPDEERAQPQRLLITLEMETDFASAAATDDLARTIDYYAVTRRLLRLGDHREWRLLETLAAEIASLVLTEFGALAVAVEIKKFIVPEAHYVAVRTRRQHNPNSAP